MKKNFFSALAFSMMLSSHFYSQLNNAIIRLPKDANGFLILNDETYRNVAFWDVSIDHVTLNQSTGQYEHQNVYKREIWGTFYEKIPLQYSQSDYVIHVTGYNSSNTPVVDEKQQMVPSGDPNQLLCEWVCNGDQYVYALQYNELSNGAGGRIFLNTPALHTPPDGYDKYYEWFSEYDFAQGTPSGPQNPGWHGMNDFVYLGTNISDQRIIKLYNVSIQDPKYSRNGDPLSGTVYGVQKYLGPWADDLGNMQSNLLAQEPCDLFIEFAIDLVNNNSENWSQLSCNSNFESGVPDADDGPEIDSVEDCMDNYYENLGTTAYTNDDGFTWTIVTVQQLISLPCEDEYSGAVGGVGNSGFHWPENVSYVTITPLDNSEGTTLHYSRSDFYDEENNFIGQTLTLPEGFFLVSYQFTNNVLKSKYVYNTKENASSFTQSSFVSYTAYPVPIVGESYNLNVTATERVSFRYTLKDVNGNILFSDNFTLDKGETMDKLISPSNGIPRGMLFNKLVFSDGSEINFQTIK